MIESFLYIPDYPIGHLIAFQIEEQMKKSGAIGPEIERMAIMGSHGGWSAPPGPLSGQKSAGSHRKSAGDNPNSELMVCAAGALAREMPRRLTISCERTRPI